jgi:DNA-binding SARP family transcriptional activator
MKFGILGQLEVTADGDTLNVRGAKQSALLAVLLLNANRVVSSDRLIDALWDEGPPDTARKALQVYVSQLRKLLGRATVVTRPPGYLLQVAQGGLDLDRFEGLVREARGAEPETAAAKLQEALSLWRGPPLADFAYDRFARPEIARLEELRLVALEERIEADLALGRDAELVGELEALGAEHPLRERLRGQLMLALYRSGRQAEALEVYQDTRRALVEELGIEPTRAVHDLERAILVQDPALDVRPRAEPGAELAADADRPHTEPIPAVPPGQERKLASVLFADLVGSTELGKQDPERTRVLLERFYDAMAEEIERAGGTVEKFIGDAVMAAFGVPAAQEDHAERALHAALAMRGRLQELFGDSLVLRIGVNTGEVVAGQAREGGSFVTGDAVNLAARLEEAAAPGEILVGDRTVAAARGAFEFDSPTTAEAKGNAQGIAGRRLLRAVSATRPRGVAGLRRSFVGRERELELLRATYERAVHVREPHLVTIMGDVGVGKTSLVRELWDWLRAQSPEPALRAGRCLPYGRGITYWALGEVL